jgi:ABC-2 type transport system ATP-binding protein
MIVVDHVSKSYGAHRALDDVSFRIEQGEVIGFLGLNGAGKSTMLKILSGLLLPSSGSFSVDGIDGQEDPRALRAKVGFLPDRPPLYDDMTVREMLSYAGRLHDVTGAQIKARVDLAMERTHVTDRRDMLVSQLSHGYRQRVGIAAAIVHKPALVILDEPISGLDPVQIVEMRKLIQTLGDEHTVLLSSHILGEIQQTCDRILVLDKGRVVAEGTDEELTRSLRAKIEVIARGAATAARAAIGELLGERALAVVDAGEGRVRITFDAGSDETRERVVAALVGAGLGVRSVREADQGLESVFLGILGQTTTTTAVEAPAGGAA